MSTVLYWEKSRSTPISRKPSKKLVSLYATIRGVHRSSWVGLRGIFDPTHHGGSKKIQPNPTHHISPT